MFQSREGPKARARVTVQKEVRSVLPSLLCHFCAHSLNLTMQQVHPHVGGYYGQHRRAVFGSALAHAGGALFNYMTGRRSRGSSFSGYHRPHGGAAAGRLSKRYRRNGRKSYKKRSAPRGFGGTRTKRFGSTKYRAYKNPSSKGRGKFNPITAVNPPARLFATFKTVSGSNFPSADIPLASAKGTMAIPLNNWSFLQNGITGYSRIQSMYGRCRIHAAKITIYLRIIPDLTSTSKTYVPRIAIFAHVPTTGALEHTQYTPMLRSGRYKVKHIGGYAWMGASGSPTLPPPASPGTQHNGPYKFVKFSQYVKFHTLDTNYDRAADGVYDFVLHAVQASITNPTKVVNLNIHMFNWEVIHGGVYNAANINDARVQAHYKIKWYTELTQRKVQAT